MIPTERKIDVYLCENLRDLREIINFLPQISLIHAENNTLFIVPSIILKIKSSIKTIFQTFRAIWLLIHKKKNHADRNIAIKNT